MSIDYHFQLQLDCIIYDELFFLNYAYQSYNVS